MTSMDYGRTMFKMWHWKSPYIVEGVFQGMIIDRVIDGHFCY
jgi:hypothetical protein